MSILTRAKHDAIWDLDAQLMRYLRRTSKYIFQYEKVSCKGRVKHLLQQQQRIINLRERKVAC